MLCSTHQYQVPVDEGSVEECMSPGCIEDKVGECSSNNCNVAKSNCHPRVKTCTHNKKFSPDGEIPGRVAVVQGHSGDGEDHLLSSTILGVNESAISLDRTEGLEMVLVSPLCQAFKDGFLAEAEKISGLRFIDGAPLSVAKEEESGSLVLTFSEDGQEKREAFDMIVILTKPKMSPEIRSLSKKLEQEAV